MAIVEWRSDSRGFNSTVIVNNDCLDSIATDPHFGKKVADAIGSVMFSGPICIGGATVVETHHADGYLAVVVGNGTAEVLGHAGNWHRGYHDMDPEAIKENWLRTVAESMGYRIVKKPNRRKQKCA